MISIGIAIVCVLLMVRYGNKRFYETGQPFHKLWAGIGLMIVIPGCSAFLFGSPLHWDVPELKGFNFVGGWVLIPELLAHISSQSTQLHSLPKLCVREYVQLVTVKPRLRDHWA